MQRFLRTKKTITIKENINKLHLITKMYHWRKEWEKVFAKYLSKKELVSRVEKRIAGI